MDVKKGKSAENPRLNTASEGSVDSTVGTPNKLGIETTNGTNTHIIIKPTGEVFSQKIYENLPTFFSPLMDLYDVNDQTRDVALLSLIAHLSAACHFLGGTYHDHFVFPNLLSIQLGAAASGKGEAKWGKMIIESIDEFIQDPKDAMKGFIIAGDTSRAMQITRLHANDGVGIISETEGDTITQNYRSDWGNLSAALRASYHNETLRVDRKGSKEVIKINRPRFSMNVNMTPGQLSSLIKERENGLFSRILFYFLSTSGRFRNPKPKAGGNSKKETCAQMGKVLKEWYKVFYKQELEFILSEDQWDKFSKHWEDLEIIFKEQYGEEITDIFIRMALSSFKILMVLSAIRLVEIPATGIVTCNDQDLTTALSLCETLFHHSMYAAGILGNNENKMDFDIKFIKELKQDFTTKDFVNLATVQGMSERTAMRKLNMLIESNFITKTAHGQYKINKHEQ